MSTTLIEKLQKAINEKKSIDEIHIAEDVIIKNIANVANEPLFDSLPFDYISNIIKRIEFNNEDQISEPLLLLQTLIEKMS